jgi:hypothetical protein
MSLIAIFVAAQALTATDLAPAGFYVAGVQQGMSLTDYNAMIANGGFKSKPLGPERYWATIGSQDVFVSFCKGRVVSAIADYRSVDWMKSMKSLENAGFKWGQPFVTVDESNSEMRTSSAVFSLIVPKGFAYGVMPMVKGSTFRDRDMPAFQLNFSALGNDCQ